MSRGGMSVGGRIAVGLSIAALTAVLCYPALRWLVGEWLGNDYYSHGFLVPVLSALAAWLLWRKWPAEQRRVAAAPAGLALVLAALAGVLASLAQSAYFLASLAMIALIAGLIWYLLGPAALRRLAFPVIFLLFMVPLPFIEPLSVPLAEVTGIASAAVVRLFGVPIVTSGSQISLPNAQLVVGAQCSGLRSIVTLWTLVALVIFMVKGPWWAKLLLALSSVLIAAFGNILRIVSLLFVANRWGADTGFNYYHDYSGIVFFASAVLLLVLASRWVGCREIRDDIFW